MFALITLGVMAGVSLFPFVIVRALNDSFLMSAIDLFFSCSCFAISAYVYKTKKTHYPGILLTIICMGGLSAVIIFQGPLFIYWAYPVIIGSYYISSPRASVLLNFAMIISIIPTFYITKTGIEVSITVLTLILTNIFSYVFSLKHHQQRSELRKLALFDALTGVRNRRALDQKLADCIGEGESSCIIIIDIDHFKLLNDEHGHKVGDELLVTVSAIISKRIRVTDILYRYGGEEFVVVTNDTSIDNCVTLAEELRTLVMAHQFTRNIAMTISIGVAELKKDEDVKAWFSRGDKALYKAKNSGRNKTFASE